MAAPSVGISLNFGGTGTAPSQSSTYQLVGPWGQTQPCTTWEEALTQMFQRHSRYTGKLGAYFSNGTFNNSGTLQPPATTIFNGTFTNGSANVTAMSINPQLVCTLGMPCIFIGASTTPGFTALPYITAILSSTSVTLSATFGGTTGSYNVYFTPYVPASANDIISTDFN